MENLVVIRDNKGVEELKAYLTDKEYVTLDTETTGVTNDSEIIGYSLAAEPNLGFYVITAYWDVAEQTLKYLETKETAKEIMAILATKKLVMHNGVFDCNMIKNNYGVDLMPALHTDTMILAHLLDENRAVGLKELGTALYGDDARKEQIEMKESVHKNGGLLTKACYELYKADAELIAKYGAKDAILTLNVFYELVPILFERGLDKFFYEDESMPLLRGATYHLNTTGLKVDNERLINLKKELQVEIAELKAFVYGEITPNTAEKFKGTSKANTYNVDSGNQLAWLLYDKLGNMPPKFTKSGKLVLKALGLKTPYTASAKREAIEVLKDSKGQVWRQAGGWDKKAKKKITEAKVKDYWCYLSTDKEVVGFFADKYQWCAKLLEYKRLCKLLSTYVEGIEERMRYGVINPSFLQHGTTSGRYSSRNPNFQNLPRDDKRVKSCIVSRPGKSFVGADFEQLEPRVFAYFSKDARLQACFASGEDFYSVVGAPIFNITDATLVKNDDDPQFFGNKYKKYRQIAKAVALSVTYGTTAPKLAPLIKMEVDEAQEVITRYLEAYPEVEAMMLEAHELVKTQGYVESLFGRRRNMPEALKIKAIYGNSSHKDLPYEIRNTLNLAVNHRIQSTGASIMNRAAIRFLSLCDQVGIPEVRLVMNVHDEIIAECKDEDAQDVALLLKEAMENTVELPGVGLKTQPKIAKNLADLK